MNYAIVIWDNTIKKFRMYNTEGLEANPMALFETCLLLIKAWGYTEVPINSKIGRQILAKIGERKV
jgi:hypothetical protein